MNHYEELGVSSVATSEQITLAYRRIARQSHPDLNPGPQAQARFVRAKQAYEVLIDPMRRDEYDKSRVNQLVDDFPRAAEMAWNTFIDASLNKQL